MTAAAPLIANARMYSATPSAQADWQQVLGWVLARAGLPWEVIAYNAPAPLSELWARDDLGLAMMCGLPFAQEWTQRPGRLTLLAVPLPSPARYGGRAVYFTDIVVRHDAPCQTLEDTFGGTVGYTLAESMSGGVAFRCHLETYRAARQATQPRLYQQAVGGLINARGIIDALDAGSIDVGPLDSYYHDILRHNAPDFAAKVRVVASTAAMPIPPLVATAALSAADLHALRQALLAVQAAPELAAGLVRLQLRGFGLATAEDYAVLDQMARSVSVPFEAL